MNFFLALILFSTFSYADVVDFGIQGRQFPIIEENGIDFINRRLKEIDKKKIKNEYKNKIEKLKISHVDIPSSLTDSNTTVEDKYYAKWNIQDPISKSIVYRKGEQIPTDMRKGEKLEMCFIDGSLVTGVVEKIIQNFGKNCTYFVDNANVFEFQKKYNVSSYPMGGQNTEYLERYDVKVLPTKITRFLNKKKVETLNVKRLAIEVMENK